MARRTGRHRRGSVAKRNGVALPARSLAASVDDCEAGRASLATGERRILLLGNAAVRHPEFARIHAAAQWIADATGATLGYLTEAANTVGAQLVNALPGEGGLNAGEVFEQPSKGYSCCNVEPEFDAADPRRHAPR